MHPTPGNLPDQPATRLRPARRSGRLYGVGDLVARTKPMTSIMLSLALSLVTAADKTDKPRKASIIAPSLPAVTQEEEDKFDDIIDRFILADTGRLKGAAAAKATKEFLALKPEAIPALIRGLNKAAKISHSCPVLMISKKLVKMLSASTDDKLLEYAKDEIGAGVKASRHAGTLRDLRFKISMRRNALARLKPQGPAGMTMTDLVRSAGRETGSKLEGVIKE